MTNENKAIKIEDRPSFQKFNDIGGTEESISQKREIIVKVESIENIDPCKVKKIMMKIEFAGSVLIESEMISIKSCNVDLGLSASITTEDINTLFIDDILAHPLLFTVTDCTSSVSASITPPSPALKLEKDNKKKISKISKTSASPSSVFKSHTISSKILGICNLDIGDLVMGKNKIRETLVVEQKMKVPPQEMVTWVKLPRLVVFVSIEDDYLIPESIKDLNVVGVTVESVYNVPKNLGEGTTFEASIPVPSLGDKMNKLVFSNGLLTMSKESDCRKKWLTLSHIEGNEGKSKIPPEVYDIINTVPKCPNLENEMSKAHYRIQWNTWRNCLILKSDFNFFFSKLMKYRIWPIEIYVANKSNEQKGKSEKSKAGTSATPANPVHFTAFLNLSSLLYPGVLKARVAAQLYTYSQKDLVDKFGADFTVSSSQSSVATVKSKATSERSKAFAKEFEECKDAPGIPVFTEDGSPVFIIVEVQFYQPFTPKKNPVYLEEQLINYLSLKGKIDKKIMNLPLAQEDFSVAIKDIVSVITKEYQNFMLNTKENKTQLQNIENDFYDFINCQENFLKIKTTLENKTLLLINEKFGELGHFRERIPQFYVYLVEQMHKITNNCVIEQNYVSSSHFNTNELQLYAEEAFEEGEYELSKEYLLLKQSRQPSNPDYWLDYAVFCITLNDCETAMEAIREALSLNSNHQMGLLLYGLLMAKLNKGDIAELAFQVLLNKYPDFIEGWMALRLIYLTVNNYEGGDVAFQMARKLEHERKTDEKENVIENEDDFRFKTFPLVKNYNLLGEGKYGMASFVNGKSLTEPLAWTTTFCPPDNINVKTAVLMLKLGFYEYALMILSKEMISEEASSQHCLYYFGVGHYLQGRYEETIHYLDAFLKRYGKDCFLWGLMGHCCYKLENISNAVACYEYVMESYNRQDDIHLIYLRMGYYYLEVKKYSCAKKTFVNACKHSPSPKLWKGVGIACLWMGELDEAELAFMEANYLDNRDAEAWAYLSLTNALLGRLKLFKHCYEEAYKRNLKNERLIQEIESCIASNQLDSNGDL